MDSSHDRPINYFQIDQQLGAVLWEIGRLSGCPLSRQSLKGIADTYSAIGRIWRSGKEPYELRGKEGLWKMMDQETRTALPPKNEDSQKRNKERTKEGTEEITIKNK